MLLLLKGIWIVVSCLIIIYLESMPAMSQNSSHIVFQGHWVSITATTSKCSTGIKIFDIRVGLIIGLISAWLANVLQVLLRQGVIPLELYGKGLTFNFTRGIWDVTMSCNCIPAPLGCFSKIKFHSWLWSCLIARASRDNLYYKVTKSFSSKSEYKFE